VTPALGLLLTTYTLAAAPAADNDSSARAEATLGRVVKLSPEQQQVWLRLVEQRYGWAVLVTMKPDDARRERERVAGILRQKSVPWNDLVGLLRKLDQREKAAVSHMVRIYRAAVYDNFRQREKEFVDRQEAWYRIWSAWEKAGSPPEQQDCLMDWLAAAIKASSKDSLGPLPGDPKFGPDVELVPEALVTRLREEQVKRLREEQAKRVAEAARPGRAEGPVPGPVIPLRGPLGLRVPDPQWSAARIGKPADVAVARGREYPLPADSGAPEIQLPRRASLREPAAGDPIALTAPPAPPRFVANLALDNKASEAVGPPERLVAGNDSGAKPQALGGTRPTAELPPTRALAPPTEPAATDRTPTLPRPALVARNGAVARNSDAPDADAAREPPPRHDVLAMLPRPALQSAAPGPEGQARYSVQRKPLGPDTAPNAADRDEQHAQVNVEELRTRIEGINLSLRTLEGELNEKHDFTADQLDSLLSRLDILVLRQRDLALFRGLITPQEQAKVGQIDSSQAAVATLGTRIAELRSRVRQNESLREADRTAAIKHLDDLSDRLATLTAGK
jgi:hypothetical protein